MGFDYQNPFAFIEGALQLNLGQWPKSGAILLVGNLKPVCTSEKSDLERLAFLHVRAVLTNSDPRGGQLLDAKQHPDFQYVCPIPPSHGIKIDQIRDLIVWARGTPQISGVKTAIISPAHSMNLQAANALLKTLEEPWRRMLFILITDKPSLLPAPIRSRCYWIRIRTPTGGKSADSTGVLVPRLSVLEDLASLQEGRTNPISLAAHWVKTDPAALKERLDVLWMVLYEEMRNAADTEYTDVKNHRWWRFLDAVIDAKRSLEASNPPNAQLLIESLLIKYSDLIR